MDLYKPRLVAVPGHEPTVELIKGLHVRLDDSWQIEYWEASSREAMMQAVRWWHEKAYKAAVSAFELHSQSTLTRARYDRKSNDIVLMFSEGSMYQIMLPEQPA